MNRETIFELFRKLSGKKEIVVRETEQWEESDWKTRIVREYTK